jgi:hypothetical protein
MKDEPLSRTPRPQEVRTPRPEEVFQRMRSLVMDQQKSLLKSLMESDDFSNVVPRVSSLITEYLNKYFSKLPWVR